MSRQKKKPTYSAEKIMKELLEAASSVYLDKESPGYGSIRRTGEELDITLLKARKLLITAGAYSSEISDEVNALYQSGKTIPEIQEIMGLSRASVHSYLPYKKGIYNVKELSLNAERIRRYRAREAAVKALNTAISANMNQTQLEGLLWDAIIQFDSYPFQTVKKMKYIYQVKGNEMLISRKEKSITRSSVNIAFHIAHEMQGNVSGPKKLKVFGASYLYPVFCRFGIIYTE
ncbi:MAG: hypothetical protein LUD14_05145 [Clostridiales bacterium]|nr:hypothetical protein [Clostridiales bacterium]